MRRLPYAFLALAALALFVAPLASREVFTFRDHSDYFQPLRFFTADILRHGHLPLWNPYNASGEPWLANPQTGVFYPPAWLFVALPFAAAYMLFLYLHLVILGWGAYLLFARGKPAGAALIGATALMLAGPTLSLVDISNNLATFAWIPLVLWCASERRPIFGGIALALAFLGGEPFFATLAAVLFVCVNRRPREIATTASIAFGLTAVQLLPFLEFVRDSDRRGAVPRVQMLRESMAVGDWIRIAIPPLRPTAADPNLGQHFIPIVYLSVIVVLLALIGIATRTRRALPWLALLAFAIVFGAAGQLTLVGDLLAALPLTLFRYPARLVPIGALAIAALAAEGWARIETQRRPLGSWAPFAVAIVIAADLANAARPLLASAPFRADVVPYDRSIGRSAKFLRVSEESLPLRRNAWIAGYLNLFERRYDAWTAAPIATMRYTKWWEAMAFGARIDLLDRTGVGYVLTPRALPPPRFERAASVAGVVTYRNTRVLPFALLRGDDGRKYAVSFLSLTPAESRVMIEAPVGGILVLSQQDAPGWNVAVDGRDAKSLRIDGVFRGVAVSAGRHEIVWRYRPFSFIAGVAITLLTSVILVIIAARKKRKTADASTDV